MGSLSVVEDINFDEETASLLTTLFTVHLVAFTALFDDDVFAASAQPRGPPTSASPRARVVIFYVDGNDVQ